MRYLKVFALAVFFFLAMLFFVQNHQILSTPLVLKLQIFNLKFTSMELPFYLVVLLAFVVGAVFSLVYFFLDRLRLQRELRGCQNKSARLEQELNSLRNMPLESGSYSGPESEDDENAGA
jgi:putative membrane protein